MIQSKLDETYNHVRPYLHVDGKNASPAIKALHEMCSTCEVFTGDEHDYTECKNRPCFECFLGYEYACWCDSWR